MSTHYKTQGFVFKKRDRGEADRVFSVFTRDYGRLEIFAKAIRKMPSKLRSGIDTFSISDIEFIQGKTRKTLTQANSANRIDGENVKAFMLMQKIGNVLDMELKGSQKEDLVYSLICEVHEYLRGKNSLAGKYLLLYCYFVWNFFASQGRAPELAVCVICKKPLEPRNLLFSYKEGSVVHEQCGQADAVVIPPDIVKILRLIVRKDWQLLTRLKVESRFQKLLYSLSERALVYSHS